MKKFLPTIIAGVAMVLIIWFSASMLLPKKVAYSYETVTTHDLQSAVSLDGKVTPAHSVDLAFERNGRVRSVSVDVDAKVKAGEVLVTLESADVNAQLEQAQASLAAQKARLLQLQHGARSEDVAVQETGATNAQASLDVSKQTLISRIKDAFTASDDAIRAKADTMFLNPQGDQPLLAFATANTQDAANVTWQRTVFTKELPEWNASLSTLTVNGDIDAAGTNAGKKLDEVRAFLDTLSIIVNGLTPGAQLPQSTIDMYKLSVSTARSGITTAQSNLLTATTGYANAQSALKLAQDQLTLKKAGATSDDIAIQTAQVAQAQAGVDALNAQLGKTVLRAPISGTVSAKNVQVGEIVAPNAPVISIISDATFEIEGQLSEADIAHVAVGQHATASLDAYGTGSAFDAVVTKLDPVETTINGVGSYKVTLQFVQANDQVKSGMSANVKIVTGEQKGVIAVPERSIFTNDAKHYVLVAADKAQPEQRSVEIGIKGADGYVEITSGLNAGDRIVSFNTRN